MVGSLLVTVNGAYEDRLCSGDDIVAALPRSRKTSSR